VGVFDKILQSRSRERRTIISPDKSGRIHVNDWVPVNSSHGELVTGDEFTVAFFHFCDEFTV